MSYHNIPNAAQQSKTNAQGKTAPFGYHYMPDGSLMSDIEHRKLYSAKTIRKFNLDLSLRPQNLDFDTYYKLAIEYEKLRS